MLSGALLAAQTGILFMVGLDRYSAPASLEKGALLVLMLAVAVSWIHRKNPFSVKK